jgi:hypothetical protein
MTPNHLFSDTWRGGQRLPRGGSLSFAVAVGTVLVPVEFRFDTQKWGCHNWIDRFHSFSVLGPTGLLPAVFAFSHQHWKRFPGFRVSRWFMLLEICRAKPTVPIGELPISNSVKHLQNRAEKELKCSADVGESRHGNRFTEARMGRGPIGVPISPAKLRPKISGPTGDSQAS